MANSVSLLCRLNIQRYWHYLLRPSVGRVLMVSALFIVQLLIKTRLVLNSPQKKKESQWPLFPSLLSQTTIAIAHTISIACQNTPLIWQWLTTRTRLSKIRSNMMNQNSRLELVRLDIGTAAQQVNSQWETSEGKIYINTRQTERKEEKINKKRERERERKRDYSGKIW